MINQPTILGVYIGLAIALIYIIVVAIKLKKKPEFNQVLLIMVSCVGLVVGVDFGYTVITENEDFLGHLKEHRLPMILGAIAIVWTSAETLLSVCHVVSFARNDDEEKQNVPE